MLRALGVTRGRCARSSSPKPRRSRSSAAASGVLLGRVLADGTVALTSTTVSTLYIATAAAPPSLGWRHVVLAFAIGVPLSLLAALVPAQEAARVPPTMAHPRHGQPRCTQRACRDARCGSAFVCWRWAAGSPRSGPSADCRSSATPPPSRSIFGAVVSRARHSLSACARGIEPARAPASLRVEDWLAVTNLSAAVPRLSISVAALAVSLSMMVAIAIMIGSFRDTVDLLGRPDAAGRSVRQPGIATAAGARRDAFARGRPHRGREPGRRRRGSVPHGGSAVRRYAASASAAAEFGVVLTHGSLLFKAPADARAAMRRRDWPGRGRGLREPSR